MTPGWNPDLGVANGTLEGLVEKGGNRRQNLLGIHQRLTPAVKTSNAHAGVACTQIVLRTGSTYAVAVETPRPVGFVAHQAGFFQHLEVLRDGGAADRQGCRYLAH